MSFAKWHSLVIGGTCALLTGALTWHAQRPVLPLPGSRQIEVVIAAGAGGVVLGVLHWILISRFSARLRRLRAYVEALGRPGSRPTPYQPKMGLSDLAGAFERTVGDLRDRVEQLLGARQELTIQARIADGERRHAEAIINSIADAVIVTDAFNEIVLANEAAANLLGFDPEQALRAPVDKVIRDECLVKLIKDTRQFGRPCPPRHVEHTIGDADRRATYDVSLSCLSSAEATSQAAPQTAGVVAVLRDVTREREIAEMKSQFVSNVSHELRTPLSSIKAYMEMLVDGEADDEQTRTEFYNVIQGETNRLSRLIDNILNVSRIEAGVVTIQRERLSLDELVHEVIEVMQPQAGGKQIELIERAHASTAQVLADKDMIYQAVLNLLSNAIKYTAAGGSVTVSVRVERQQRQAVVVVSDTGVGIPQDNLPHLFNKFYRVADHKKIAPGTGLGLSLVRHIVEAVHDGRIGVTSQVGVGSTFTLALPLAKSQGVPSAEQIAGSSLHET